MTLWPMTGPRKTADKAIMKPPPPWPRRPVVFVALAISIPAFYFVLTGPDDTARNSGRLLYAACAAMIVLDIAMHCRTFGQVVMQWRESAIDGAIALGALASAWPTQSPWSSIEWLMRLGLCGLIFLRLSMLLVSWLARGHLMQILAIAAGGLAFAGAGFYWLEPKVLTYADGLWLAFITGATVGYGDLVPSTPASRIFAIFIVLLGYALFSVVTASIAALFVGEDEKRFEKELHTDIRALRAEIVALRDALGHADDADP